MRRAASTGVVSTEKSWEPQPEVRNPARDLNSKPEVPGALNAMCRWKGTPPKRPKLKTQHVCAAGGASGIRGCGSPSQRAEDRKLLVVSSNQKTLGCRVWGPEVISTLPLSGGRLFRVFVERPRWRRLPRSVVACSLPREPRREEVLGLYFFGFLLR